MTPAIRRIGLVGCALLVGFAIVLVRGEPIVLGDQGVFLSIAARMLDGDHLYSGVVDNKDPLFFYTYAGALWVGGWRAPFALDGIWLAIAGMSFALLLRELRAPRPAVVAGFFMYPLALTIGWYEPGLSMLGGLAFAPLVGWLWLRGRFAASGAALGVVMLFKLSVVLVAAGPVAAFIFLGAPGGSRVRQLAKGAAGVVTVVGAAAAVLAVRGELRAYLDVLVYDFYYTDEGLVGRGKSSGIAGHLGVVREFLGGLQTVAAVVVLGVFLVAVYVGRTRQGRAFQLVAAAAITTLIATLTTLALTAIWPHHLQMLAYPVVLVAAALITVTRSYHGQRAGMVAAGVCVLFLVLSTAKDEVRHGVPAARWFSAPQTATAAALETARMRFYGRLDRVTYMHLGQNSENAHAVFLNDGFALTCPRFHQYPHDPGKQLRDVLDCVKKANPMLILVTPSLFDLPGATAQWDTFVSGAQHLLESRYDMISKAGGVEVWKRTR